jgi:hypothetical protein
MRARRFALFERLCDSLSRPLKVLDVGGTNSFWEQRGWAGREDFEVTLVNLEAEERKYANIIPTAGDATHLGAFADQSFHIVFSNSVIEHLFTYENQRRMANEVRRVARAYWVQTPNYWFPMEPHFHVPGWQWMPERLRIRLIQRHTCGWRGPCPDPGEAAEAVREVRLLTHREMTDLFPGATIVQERYLGLTKSFIALAGFPRTASLRLDRLPAPQQQPAPRIPTAQN